VRRGECIARAFGTCTGNGVADPQLARCAQGGTCAPL